MLNITLVFQVVAFLVTYLILTYLVWRPAIAVVQAEDAQQFLLEQQVTRVTQDVNFKSVEYDRNWYRLRHELQAHKPTLAKPLSFASIRAMPEIMPTKHDIDTLIMQTKAAIVKQVAEDHFDIK